MADGVREALQRDVVRGRLGRGRQRAEVGRCVDGDLPASASKARAWSRTAATRPRSSSADGRRPRVTARTASIASRARVRSRSTASAAAAGSDSSRLWTASSPSASPASWGPSPSCRSERRRRRSASRASTRVSWERRSCSVSWRAWSTGAACRATSAKRSRSGAQPRTTVVIPQHPHGCTAEEDGQLDEVPRGPTALGQEARRAVGHVECEPDVGQGEGVSERRDHRLRELIGRDGVLQPPTECCHGRIGIMPLSPSEPVYDTLQAGAQRPDEHRHHRRGRAPVVPSRRALEHRADHHHGHHVEPDHQHRQRAVDERAVDDDVDVEQAVAQDREPGGRQRYRDQAEMASTTNSRWSPPGSPPRRPSVTTSSAEASTTHLTRWRSSPLDRAGGPAVTPGR